MKKIKIFLYHIKRNLLKRLSIIRRILIPPKNFMPPYWERIRIMNYPSKKVFTSQLLHKRILISDAKWYIPVLQEIWQDQIYKFETENNAPLIIDCGANIGLSVIYWKYLYPNSKIIAFEPDPKIFELLKSNIQTFALSNVDLRSYAVWTSSSELSFLPDDSLGGKLVDKRTDSGLLTVKTIRLLDLLDQPVDMLKIDIEGAEYEVLKDCADAFRGVKNLFVEYHGTASEPQTLHIILQILQDSGFRYHIKEANPIAHPFVLKERSSYFDLQLNIFAFRN